jgi:hypothetical protein
VVGTIVEMTSVGTRPVADASVYFSLFEEAWGAITYSDGDGRFGLCGLPPNDKVRLVADLNDRVAYTDVPPGQTDITITLPQ